MHRYRRTLPSTRRDRGVVLLLVLGIITLLSVLVVSFVFESRIELSAAKNFENTIIADEIATAAAQHGVRLLELDKRRRALGPDDVADSGDEEARDSLIDIWRGGFTATVRLTYAADTNEAGLTPGGLLFDMTGTTAVGTIMGVDTTPAPGGTITIITENPNAWVVGNTMQNTGTPGGTQFSQAIATKQVAGNAVDLNADAAIQQSNSFDDDSDGTTDEADEGLDGAWFNYYDQQGRLAGRYAVLIEDESAKANLNVVHNLAQDTGTRHDPLDNTFSQNEGVTASEIDFEQATQSDAAESAKLLFYRYGRPFGDAGTAYGAANESNRIYVPGQGRADAGVAYSDRDNDDDDASRFRQGNWYNARAVLGADGVDNDANGCIDEFGETPDGSFPGGTINLIIGDGVDNDGDGCIDELDEGVNDVSEYRPLNPVRLQPQAATDFEVDGVDNDTDNDPNGDGTPDPCPGPGCDEANEGDDQPLLSLEDVIAEALVNMPPGGGGESWLAETVQYADSLTDLTPRRNLVSIQSQDANVDRFENPRTNPNYATAEEIATAARSPFQRGFDTFREVEFQTLQAAINLYDYRDRNHIRDEIQDAAGNVFSGVEAVRITEVMVAPRTDYIDAEVYDQIGAAVPDLTEAHGLGVPFAGHPNGGWTVPVGPGGAGRPRGAENYLTNLAAGAAVGVDWEYSGPLVFTLPAAIFPAVVTDNDSDTVFGEDAAVDTDGDGVWADEDVGNGIDDDGDGATDEDLLEDDDGVPDALYNEDGPGSDYTFKLVMRVRTNANFGITIGTASLERGFLVLINGDAVYPSPVTGGPSPITPTYPRWGVPPTLNAQTDGKWFIQQGLVNLESGANTLYLLKPAPSVLPLDDIDIDWFYFTREPDDEWIEVVNIGEEDVDVSGWSFQVDAVEDLDQSGGVANTPISTTLTIPGAAGSGTTVLTAPRNNAGVVQHTVFAVDAVAGVPVGNGTLDDESAHTGGADTPDLIAFDQPFGTPTGPVVQLESIGNIFTRPSNGGLLTGGQPGGAADDFVPDVGLLPSEPIDDATNNVTVLDPRDTPDESNDGGMIQGVDVGVVTLLDASGNVVDRVTYDGSQYDPLLPAGTIRGFRSLERLNPVSAGERLVRETSSFAGTTTVDNFYMIRQAPTVVADAVPVLADGNYDNWFPDDIYNLTTPPLFIVALPGAPTSVFTGVDATPGEPNDADADTFADPDTAARVKNRHLANVGELGAAPFPRAGTSMTVAGINALYDDTSTVEDNLRLDDAGSLPALEVATVGYTITEEVTGANALGVADTALTVGTGQGALLTVGGSLWDIAAGNEVVQITAIATDDLTISRDRDGGGPLVHLAGATYVYAMAMGTGALTAAATSLTVDTGQGALLSSPTGLLRDTAAGSTEVIKITFIAFDTLTIERGVNGTVAETHLANALYEYAPGGGETITNIAQANTRMALRTDIANHRMLVFDDSNDSPWELANALANATGFLGLVAAQHQPQPVDVAELVDAYSVGALVLEPTIADVTAVAPWANTAGAGNPDEYTITIANVTQTLDMTWDAADGVTAGNYSLYVFAQAGAQLTVNLLNEAGTPIGALQRANLSASEGDHLVAYGTLTIPYDTDVGEGLRLRFTNAGTLPGSGVTQNRVTRVVLTPPELTLGRVNLNTATDRMLLGLPGGNTSISGTPIAELLVQDRQENGPFSTVADPFLPGRVVGDAITSDTVDNDVDGTTDEADEAEFFLRPMSNLTTVRSDVYKVTVLGQAAIDANNDGIIQDDEVRAEKKLEFIYER